MGRVVGNALCLVEEVAGVIQLWRVLLATADSSKGMIFRIDEAQDSYVTHRKQGDRWWRTRMGYLLWLAELSGYETLRFLL